MVKGSISGKTELAIKEISQTAIDRDLELLFPQKDSITKDSLKSKKQWVKGKLIMEMAKFIRDK